MRNSVGILVSGGVDSDVMLAEMAKTHKHVWPMYIRQGLAWEKAELYWLKRFLKWQRNAVRRNVVCRNAVMRNVVQPLRIFSLPMNDVYGSHWSTGRKPPPGAKTPDASVYLPGRNLLLSIKPAVFAVTHGISRLFLGSLEHNPFADASPGFYKKMGGEILSIGLSARLTVAAPYRYLSKVQVIRRGKEIPLHLSFSCIAPKGTMHCGACNKCAERRRAFQEAGVQDRTRYVKN